MDFRKIPSAILFLFIAVSVVVLAVKQYRAGEGRVTASSRVPRSPVRFRPQPVGEPVRRLVVYYFHGASRSATCKNVEALAQEAILGGFAEQVKAGRIEWHVVDYDQPENRHFKIDYDLDVPALVFVRMRGDRQWGWDRLDEAPDLASDKPRFFDLLQRQVRETLAP